MGTVADKWKHVIQLEELAIFNLELAMAELDRCQKELRTCLINLYKALDGN